LKSKSNKIEQLTQENQQKEKSLAEQKQFKDIHTALQEKFNTILAEKAGLENELDAIRVQMQTTESKLNKKKQDQTTQLEELEKKVKLFQVPIDLHIMIKIYSFRF
jgi:chromosome segregation ATPase